MQPQFEFAFALKIGEEVFSSIFISLKIKLIFFLLESSTLNCQRFFYKHKFKMFF